MYKGFNLTLSDSFLNTDLSMTQYDICIDKEENKQRIRKKVEDFMNAEGTVSADEIVEDWFDSIEADIFISHSHRDEDLAIKLAIWLQDEFGLTSFIDSCVWGNFVDLSKDFNNRFSKSEFGSTYDYDKAQNVFAHMNTILNTSLTKMIDKCEVVFFLNTENSISDSSFSKEGITLSPWIYHELLISKVIRKTPHIRGSMESKFEEKVFDSMISESLKIEYDLEIDHLYSLNEQNLDDWKRFKAMGVHPLTVLYSIIKPYKYG